MARKPNQKGPSLLTLFAFLLFGLVLALVVFAVLIAGPWGGAIAIIGLLGLPLIAIFAGIVLLPVEALLVIVYIFYYLVTHRRR